MDMKLEETGDKENLLTTEGQRRAGNLSETRQVEVTIAIACLRRKKTDKQKTTTQSSLQETNRKVRNWDLHKERTCEKK